MYSVCVRKRYARAHVCVPGLIYFDIFSSAIHTHKAYVLYNIASYSIYYYIMTLYRVKGALNHVHAYNGHIGGQIGPKVIKSFSLPVNVYFIIIYGTCYYIILYTTASAYQCTTSRFKGRFFVLFFFLRFA